MNRLKYLLLAFVLISCENVVYDAENFVPIVEINQTDQIIESGESVLLSASVTDEDHTIHYYAWTVDGNIISTDESFMFSMTPNVDTLYTIGVAVTDGEGIGSDEIEILVKEPLWTPQPLHIYFFHIGAELVASNVIVDYEACDNAQYQSFLSSTATALTIYNRDNDPDCYRVFGGEI